MCHRQTPVGIFVETDPFPGRRGPGEQNIGRKLWGRTFLVYLPSSLPKWPVLHYAGRSGDGLVDHLVKPTGQGRKKREAAPTNQPRRLIMQTIRDHVLVQTENQNVKLKRIPNGILKSRKADVGAKFKQHVAKFG